jgi:FtsZ-binding cell division protein ZapB
MNPAKLKHIISDLQQQLKNHKQTTNYLISDKDNKINLLSQENENLKQENENLKQENEKLKQENEKLKQENGKLKQENAKSKQANDDTKTIEYLNENNIQFKKSGPFIIIS